MQLGDFNYRLPDELIARHPLAQRTASRLLCLNGGLDDRRFHELPKLLRPDDLLVFNDTRVVNARLHAQKASGGKAEVLIERLLAPRRALAHVKASKSPKPGSSLLFPGASATVAGRDGALFALEFDCEVETLMAEQGEVPLPPYLGRQAEPADLDRYQTVYAREPGAVAAPTAGLHFDEALLDALTRRGILSTRVTLHVGAGTFQSLRHEKVSDNRLHAERLTVSDECCEAVRDAQGRGGRVIAVGTTSVRALESASAGGELSTCNGETELFIVPGYRFRTVDAMITNFHLPQSSLLMLVAAFCGTERILAAYAHAVRERYRFFSYGDAMLLSRQEAA